MSAAAERIASVPSPNRMKSIVGELARVKGEQNIETALAIYHPEGELVSQPMGTASRGATALRKSLEAFFRFAPDYSPKLSGMAADGDTLCAWGDIGFTPTYTPRGDRPNGSRVTTPVFILFRFKDDRVAWESFHFDVADVARQAGVPAEAFRRLPNP
jgi:predicted ester cyclase